MKGVSIILTITLCCSAYLGDFIVFKSKFATSQVFKVIADSLVHATLGFLSSLVFFSNDMRISSHALAYNVIFCTFMSSLIDVDHIFVARSFKWKDLTSLKQRGIFHCTTFWLFTTTFLLIYSFIVKKSNIYVLTWMLVIAYSSHHIRDANRRGLWLYPFGHTPAFSKIFYVIMLVLVPHLCSFVYHNTAKDMYTHTTIEYKTLV